MSRVVKADFHLHTYHSDNQDRMTPQEYVRLGRAQGFDVLGFCDHHHNLTQAAWQTLQAEVAALADGPLLLTTGYEATFVVGHLCVLDKREFDGESVAECRRQLWSPANTRILAHPDNNACAWLLPLPVAVQGVEVINGGQDLYSYRAVSPCNGLTTYARYLLLNHPLAAVAQSDCHVRAIFGRVWTGLTLPAEAPLTWAAVQDALRQGHAFACMGDLPLRVWTASGASMGDTLSTDGDADLLWEVAPGSEVTVYVADRPVAYFAPGSQTVGRYPIQGNGPHWLLAKRGLSWSVSSPVWVQNQPADAQAGRARLTAESAVQRAADGLRRRLDWLQTLHPHWGRSAMPVAAYHGWLHALLPEYWPDQDMSWTPGRDLTAIAQTRLAAARQIADAVLADVIRAAAVTPQPQDRAPRLVVAMPPAHTATEGERRGLIQFTVDVPRDWAAISVTDAAGDPIPHISQAVDGQRDPIHSPRTRVQVEEITVWLAHGEMHEYGLRHAVIQRDDERLDIQIDLYPEELGIQPHPDPAAAEALAATVADPTLTHIDVHLRMPRRFAVIAHLDIPAGVESYTLHIVQASPRAEGATPPAAPSEQPSLLNLAGQDMAEEVIVVQVG